MRFFFKTMTLHLSLLSREQNEARPVLIEEQAARCSLWHVLLSASILAILFDMRNCVLYL